MAEAVPVMAARLLFMPNMLLLAFMVASFARSCEWPDTYVKAPSPMKVALPGAQFQLCDSIIVCSKVPELTNDTTRRAVVILRFVLLQRLLEGRGRDFWRHVRGEAGNGVEDCKRQKTRPRRKVTGAASLPDVHHRVSRLPAKHAPLHWVYSNSTAIDAHGAQVTSRET